jgi:LysR family nitrogen assimilation transcriptional regulator
MNLKQLEYFVQVAEIGSFSKAATILGIAQPALSRHVRGLETELREYLFVRNGRGVVLTDAGRRLFDHGVAIIRQVELARQDLGANRDEPVGLVTIGLPPSVGRELTVALVERFQATFPAARLAIVEGLSTHILEWIATGRIDAGLVYNPEAQPGIEIVPLRREHLGLVGKAGGNATPVPMRDLGNYRLIVPERMHAMRRLLETEAAMAGIKLDIAWEISSVPSIADLVCAGHGFAVLSEAGVAASSRAAELFVRRIVDPGLMTVLCLASSATKRPTPLAARTMDLLTDLTRSGIV